MVGRRGGGGMEVGRVYRSTCKTEVLASFQKFMGAASMGGGRW